MKRKTSHVLMRQMMMTSLGAGISLLNIALLMRVLTNCGPVPSVQSVEEFGLPRGTR